MVELANAKIAETQTKRVVINCENKSLKYLAEYPKIAPSNGKNKIAYCI